MAEGQRPLLGLLNHLLTFHILFTLLSRHLYALNMESSYCKCENFPIEDRPFVAIWNAPTGGCNVNYSVNINLKNFDILENPGQTWNGKYVTIFYNAQLGLYPYFTNEQGTNSYNDGMPQLVNLAAHLEKAEKDITSKIPDPHFSGVGVIDWEGWRPIWERNFDSKRIYQSRSVELVQAQHPDWSMAQLIEEAKEQFETSARMLMESSIKLARRLRPKGKWGFYGFPDCFGSEDTNYHCSKEQKEMNNKLKWLFCSSSALYPSIYMYSKQPWNKAFAFGRLEETFRLAAMVYSEKKHRLPVFPYFRHLYEGKPLEFDYLSDIDLGNTIGQAAEMGASGVVMWGNRRDENTSPQVCRELNHYIETLLGPYFESVKLEMETCSEVKCNGRGRCVSRRYIASRLVNEEPDLYSQTCSGSPRRVSHHIRQPSMPRHQVSHHDQHHASKESSKVTESRGRQSNVLNTKDKEILAKELSVLNSSGQNKTFVKSHGHKSSKDFVVFMSTQGSAVEVNKAPQAHSDVTLGGVTASSGLHFHDKYDDSPSFRQTASHETLAPSKLMLCNDSSPDSSNCEIMKESPSTFSRGFRFPHLYVVFICVSLGSALLISSAFILSYYFCNIHKRVKDPGAECEQQVDNSDVINREKVTQESTLHGR